MYAVSLLEDLKELRVSKCLNSRFQSQEPLPIEGLTAGTAKKGHQKTASVDLVEPQQIGSILFLALAIKPILRLPIKHTRTEDTHTAYGDIAAAAKFAAPTSTLNSLARMRYLARKMAFKGIIIGPA